jgi:hypothetical protein
MEANIQSLILRYTKRIKMLEEVNLKYKLHQQAGTKVYIANKTSMIVLKSVIKDLKKIVEKLNYENKL